MMQSLRIIQPFLVETPRGGSNKGFSQDNIDDPYSTYHLWASKTILVNMMFFQLSGHGTL